MKYYEGFKVIANNWTGYGKLIVISVFFEASWLVQVLLR